MADLRVLIGRRVHVFDDGIIDPGREIVAGPLVDVITGELDQIVVDDGAGGRWQIPLDEAVVVAVEVVGAVDLDELAAIIAGDPAPDARHAARVLRHLPEVLKDTRERRGLAVGEAAKQVGWSQQRWARFEQGAVHPILPDLIRLLDWIGGTPGGEQHA